MSGCNTPLFKHVVSHRRQPFMILNNHSEEFNISFHVRVADYDYMLFAMSFNMKCFGCGAEGHLVKACPDRAAPAPTQEGERRSAAMVPAKILQIQKVRGNCGR